MKKTDVPKDQNKRILVNQMSTNIYSLENNCPPPNVIISSAFPFSKLFHHGDKYKQTNAEEISDNITVKKIKSFRIHHLHMTQVLEIYKVVNSIKKFKA